MSCASSPVPSLSLNSGFPMPQIGFGTWMCKPTEVNEIVKNAIRNGYRHLDCAFIYQNQSEIGAALKEMVQHGEIKREDLFITSKVWNTFHSFDAALANVHKSLEQLGLDYLDLCLIHWPMGYKEGTELFPKDAEGQKVFLSDVDFLDTWRALEKAVALGKVRSIGVSNFNSAQIQRIIDNCNIRPSVLQTECHVFFQQKKLRTFCKNNGIHFVASCPLGSSADNSFRKSEYPSVFEHPTISEIASLLQKSNAQVALRFLTQFGVGVVPRSSDAQRQRQNLDIFGFSLNDQQMAQIEALDTGKRILYLTVSAHSPHFPFGTDCPDDRGQTEL
ncbi:hypothetical protein niasHT_007062 [Heterodera trifolii]|uniref:NADP-dependent oxidoreductase domain-containing protein n=1 Tax=Heterodera trifolii TaxID=157864 RepID=A0ABD2M0A4_9BILA